MLLMHTASHPACLSRTGHPFSDGKFSDCGKRYGLQDGNIDGVFLDKMREMIRAEFKSFRKEIFEMYKADIEGIKSDVKCLSARMDKLEGTWSGSQPLASSTIIEEDIIEELEDRERRSRNLILFNLEESESDSHSDIDAVNNNILQQILQDKKVEMKVARLEKKRKEHRRPVCVSVPTKRDTINTKE